MPLPALVRPEPRHLVGVDVRVAAPEPATERRAGRVVVDDERPATRAHHPVELGRARARSRDRRSRPSARASRRPTRPAGAATSAEPSSTVTLPSRRTRRRAIAARSGCGSTPVTERAVPANSGRWKPVPQPMSRTSRPAHGASDSHQRGDRAGAVERAVLDLVDLRVVPDVRARDGARATAGSGARATRARASRTVRCGRARWGSGTGRRRCRGCRSGRPTRPSRPRGAGRPTGRATPRRGPGRRRSPGPRGRPRRWRRHSGGLRRRCPTRRRTAAAGRPAGP